MKKYLLYGVPLTVTFLLCITSCTKKVDNDTTPTITSIVPASAHGGDTITVYGTNLANISNPGISINNKTAAIISVSDKSIQIVVPPKAGSGKVILSFNGQSYEGPEFNYQYKVIVTTIAGTGSVGHQDGHGESASFYCPWGIAADKNGDLFIADCYSRLIRKISDDNIVSGYGRGCTC